MNGITFGNKHTYDDWGLVLTNKTLGLPTPKTSSVDIEGADGVIDTSEVLCGEIKFNNRTLEFEFTMTTDYDDYHELITDITNYLHGRKLKIILDEDDKYYYVGRCQINEWSSDKRIGKIVIKCDCEPYKYMSDKCISTANINGTTHVKVFGRRMTVNPIIEVTSDMTITVDGEDRILKANRKNEIPDLFIKEGVNILEFKGNGIAKITYVGGEL